jgi:hypothetical protein
MPFIFNWIPLRCGFNLMMGKWTMFVRSILVTLCITAQVKVYLVTRRYLRQAEVRPLSIPLQQMVITPPNNGEESLRPASATAEESSSSMSVVANTNKNAPFFVHRRNKTVSKLELEASLTLLVGVSTLCIITGIIFISFKPNSDWNLSIKSIVDCSAHVYRLLRSIHLSTSGRRMRRIELHGMNVITLNI